jgi:hypothetical protein
MPLVVVAVVPSLVVVVLVLVVQPLLAEVIHERELTFVVYFVTFPDAFLEALEVAVACLAVLRLPGVAPLFVS